MTILQRWTLLGDLIIRKKKFAIKIHSKSWRRKCLFISAALLGLKCQVETGELLLRIDLAVS